MAHVEPLPDGTLQTIAQQLSPIIRRSKRGAPVQPGEFTLAEAFPLWALGLDAVTRPNENLTVLVNSTGYWQHQVRSGTSATHLAKSRPLGPGQDEWEVVEAIETDAAAHIDSAIEWIDNNVQGDPNVRMLVAPAYYVTAFWLIYQTENQIVIGDMPDNFTQLEYRKVYSSREFLEALSREQPVVVPL